MKFFWVIELCYICMVHGHFFKKFQLKEKSKLYTDICYHTHPNILHTWSLFPASVRQHLKTDEERHICSHTYICRHMHSNIYIHINTHIYIYTHTYKFIPTIINSQCHPTENNTKCTKEKKIITYTFSSSLPASLK